MDAKKLIALIKQVKSTTSINDDAPNMSVLSALITDEEAAIAAYNVAIQNFKDKVSDKAIAVLIHIRDEEIEHVKELQAIEAHQESDIVLDSEIYLSSYYTDNNGVIRVYIDGKLVGSFASKSSAIDAGYGIDTTIKELRR